MTKARPRRRVVPPFRGYCRPGDITADRRVHPAALILCVVGVPLRLEVAGRPAEHMILSACLGQLGKHMHPVVA